MYISLSIHIYIHKIAMNTYIHYIALLHYIALHCITLQYYIHSFIHTYMFKIFISSMMEPILHCNLSMEAPVPGTPCAGPPHRPSGRWWRPWRPWRPWRRHWRFRPWRGLPGGWGRCSGGNLSSQFSNKWWLMMVDDDGWWWQGIIMDGGWWLLRPDECLKSFFWGGLMPHQ